MPIINRTRPLATELEYAAEKVRDQVIPRFLSIVYPGVTDAFRLSGESDLMIEPETDPMWNARAERCLSDLGHVEIVLDTLVEHMCRDNVAVERILAEQRGHEATASGDPETDAEINQLRSEVARMRRIVAGLNGDDQDGAL